MTVSVGGEIGEVGKKNSTEDELRPTSTGYRRELDARAPGAIGISKVSVQTGTSHGGVPLPDGSMAEVKLDFEVIRRLGEVAREHGLAGAVQHGASTLPDELFHRFPAVETAEIHLATGFQNALYEHPAFPAELHRADRGVVLRERARRAQARPDRPAVRVHDAQEGDRAVQARALGARRRRTRSSPPSAARSRSCSRSSASTARGTMVERYIHPVEQHPPMPDALRATAARGARAELLADRPPAGLLIRPETPADTDAIDRVQLAAFGDPQIPPLIAAIRASPNYLPDLALVAELARRARRPDHGQRVADSRPTTTGWFRSSSSRRWASRPPTRAPGSARALTAGRARDRRPATRAGHGRPGPPAVLPAVRVRPGPDARHPAARAPRRRSTRRGWPAAPDVDARRPGPGRRSRVLCRAD